MQEAATLLPQNELPGSSAGSRTGANAVFFDAFDDEEDAAPAIVAAHLQEIVPIPLPANTSKLEDEASRHRVLLVRGGAVIAVTTIIAVGGALLIHAIFAGLIILGSLFPWFQGSSTTSGGAGSASADDGAGSFSMLGAGPDDNGAPSPNPVYTAGKPAADLLETALPTLKPLPEPRSRDVAAQLMQAAAPDLPASSFGSVRVAPPKAQAPTAPAINETSLAPPQVGSGTVAGVPGTAARGTATGNGGGTDDEPVFNWVKGSGSGNGRGSGAGNGIDRGMSAADRPAQLLSFGTDSDFNLPMQYQIKPPQQSVKLIVTVDSEARVVAVKLDQSCGIKDIDDLVTAWARTLRFSPAYKAGKAVTSEFPLERSFGAF